MIDQEAMDPQTRVVILGAGHGGGSVAAFLRQYGFVGPITLVGEEPLPPYQRPPLSKAWLKGEATAESLALKPLEFYAENNIDLRLGVHAVAIDRASKTVAVSEGDPIAYDVLVLAMGARARRLTIPGADLKGVMELRTAADAEKLKTALGVGKTLAVVGGGYVGLEAAASAISLNAKAVIIEREHRVLARVACEQLSSFFQAYHAARGVTFELSAGVEAFVGDQGQVTGVKLADGRTIACDAALVGVGAIPNDEIAKAAGLECSNGVVVDLAARTSDPAIFAVGDLTQRPMPLYSRSVRLESVPNALEQAKAVACAVTGRPLPPPEVPWFWSDQFDLKLQIAGMPFDADEILIRGDPDTAKFAVFHLKQGCIQAVEAVNAAPEFMAGKQLVASQKPVARDKLVDMSISMKQVAV